MNPDTGAVIDSDVVDAALPVPIAGLAYLNGRVYLELLVTEQILVWDPVLDVAVTTLNVAADLGGGLTGAADRGVLYDSNGAGHVFKIDPGTGAVLATFSPGVGPLYGGLAYVNGELIASPCATMGTAYRLNPDTGAVLGNLPLGGTGYVTALGGDGAGSSSGAHTMVLAPRQVVTDRDFGNQFALGRIEGKKWNDLNGNGLCDAGEPSLLGWMIYLDTDNDGQFDDGEPNQDTDAAGHYVFTDLTPGTYHVREVIQPGWRRHFPALRSGCSKCGPSGPRPPSSR